MTHNDQSDEGSDLEPFTDEDSNTNTSFELKRKVRQPSTNGFHENGHSSSSTITGEKEKNSRLPKDEESWESFLGDSEEKSTILIRWPDGTRDTFTQPSDSQLKSLLLFIESNGYSSDNYEVVTNFPRKQIDTLQPDLSLKTVGLFPRETVFVHLKDN